MMKLKLYRLALLLQTIGCTDAFISSHRNYRYDGGIQISYKNVRPSSNMNMNRKPKKYSTSTLVVLSNSPDYDNFGLIDENVGTILIVSVAITLLVASQTFINTMLKGDQGLSAFLSDGSGFNKSGYRPRSSKEDQRKDGAPLSGEDPLPWLKLPELDFVEVKGQEKTSYSYYEDDDEEDNFYDDKKK